MKGIKDLNIGYNTPHNPHKVYISMEISGKKSENWNKWSFS